MKKALIIFLCALGTMHLAAQTAYKLPPREVVDILDAPPTPIVIVSPHADAMLLIEYKSHPSIELLARPFLRLAGVRVDPELKSRQRTTQYISFTVNWIHEGKTVKITAPDDARIGSPLWSYDGRRIAFRHDGEKGVGLWIADARTGEAKSLLNITINDILGTSFSWMNDNTHLLVKMIPEGIGKPPEMPRVPVGPIVEETSGKFAKVQTYQDLLRTPYDENLFEYYGATQLAIVDVNKGIVSAIGSPGLILNASFAPDEKYLLVTKLKHPFSYRVPYNLFTRTIEVWNRSGKIVATIADLPISDEVPTQGVPTGPRDVLWQRLSNTTLLWVEALDGGDPLKKVPYRDRLMRLSAPFTSVPEEVMKIQHRFSAVDWTARKDEILLTEFDRERRWRMTSFIDLTEPANSKRILFDLSINDAYNDPGEPVYETNSKGVSVLNQEGDWIHLSAVGASENGDRPRLDRFNLKSLKKETLFRSEENDLERFVAFADNERKKIVTRYESKTEPPNYVLIDMKGGKRVKLTDFKDPAPQLTGLKKELIKYFRKDGVQLSGTLYLPPGYVRGTKLPLLVWAYPLEYSDPATAGQVRGSPNSFTFFRGPSPLFFLTQGYAVLMDATMPVVGDPETMNNTFIEQIAASGKAAIDKLDSMNVIDRNRVFVSGHSYGAFMTANLLAHTDDFAAGIARSGAYNRSLTPFGFQSERRSFWEAPEIYMKVSPFTYANKINEPLLLVHGDADNNPGTHTIQSERLYQAIKGNGGTARLVLLPYESHGYTARESVLHTLAEMFEWADKYVKNRVFGEGKK